MTNNDIMWDCIIDIFNDTPTKHERVSAFIQNYQLHKGEEFTENFSHDNWTLVLCWLYKFNPDEVSKVPTLGHHSKHPLRLVQFLWMKYKWLGFLKPLTMAEMLFSYKVLRRKTEGGRYHTSGLLLDYYVAYTYQNDKMMDYLTKLMLTMYNSWEEVFIEYHGKDSDVYKAFTTRKDLTV